MRGAIKLHSFSTKVLSEAILLQLLSSNWIISIHLCYCLTIEQFLIQVPSEVRQAYWKGCIKNGSIVKLYNKVLLITNIEYFFSHSIGTIGVFPFEKISENVGFSLWLQTATSLYNIYSTFFRIFGAHIEMPTKYLEAFF